MAHIDDTFFPILDKATDYMTLFAVFIVICFLCAEILWKLWKSIK